LRLQAVFETAEAAVAGHKGMSAQAMVAVVTDGHLEVAHLGDSRLWHMSTSQLDAQGLFKVTQLTNDHTLQEDYRQAMGDSLGEAELQALPQVLTRMLGAKSQPTLAECALGDGDRILITTSRLHQTIPRQQLEQMMRQKGPTPVYVVTEFVHAAEKDDDGYACVAAEIYQRYS
jgi:serine/threonine protein phosphatase PrpC